ncbi:choice-of-anchor P family protein [Nocardioides speluncae]|uniref:choice-of-anchor P family protein n=1 Tax=Nocardioides speluncae TaxID=2670337 RepID=UPI000D692115|nr:choice-of-anchor P family protein [Nocardioides speluncae]
MRPVSRPLTRAATLFLALGLAVASPLGGLSPVAPASADVVLTDYGFSNSAWGTEVVGGSLPVGSGATAHIVTSCTRKAGLDKTNEIVGVDLGGQVKVSGVKSRSRTYRGGGGFHSWSQSYLAKVDLGGGAPSSRASPRRRTPGWTLPASTTPRPASAAP